MIISLLPSLTVVLFLFFGLSDASPIKKRGGFTIRQVRRGNLVARHPAVEVAGTLHKHGMLVPRQIADAAAAAANDPSVVTTPIVNDALFVCPVTVGGQQLDMLFDTGTADFIVMSNLLPAEDQEGRTVYDTTGKEAVEGASWNIVFGDGSNTGGLVFTDTVDIGGATVTEQAVQAATLLPTSFEQAIDLDGIHGLSFSTLNRVEPEQVPTWFDNVKGSLEAPLFTVDLKRNEPGSFDFGFIDNTKHEGDIVFTDVDSQSFGGRWLFNYTGFIIGETETTIELTALADTGSTAILLPTDIVEQYFAAVPGAVRQGETPSFQFPCDSALPDFTLIVEGTPVTVPGELLNLSPVDETGTNCFGSIQDGGDIPVSVLGQAFFKSQFAVFEAGDGTTPRIGFAPKAQVGTDLPNPPQEPEPEPQPEPEPEPEPVEPEQDALAKA